MPKVNKYVLDTSALLTFYFEEPGALKVWELIKHDSAEVLEVWVPFMSLMEFSYAIWQRDGEIRAEKAYKNLKAMGLKEILYSEALLIQAVKLKATPKMSLADAWIAASAFLLDAVLVHKDPEFEALKGQIKTLKLPYK